MENENFFERMSSEADELYIQIVELVNKYMNMRVEATTLMLEYTSLYGLDFTLTLEAENKTDIEEGTLDKSKCNNI